MFQIESGSSSIELVTLVVWKRANSLDLSFSLSSSRGIVIVVACNICYKGQLRLLNGDFGA